MNVQNTPSHSAYAETAEEAIAAQDALDNATITSEEATDIAMQNTLLTPRFYTTDFDEMDAIDVTPVRDTWDELIAEMKSDPNKGHFKKTDAWEADWDGMDPALKAEFIDFLISSCTAGFINDALREAGIRVNLGFLTQQKKYTYFRPKFIYYATYLSEKIGYARYITIYRHLEAHPDKVFHPIFQWFREWCNDEFRHGEAFALLMKTDPKLTQSPINKLWIKFFLTAVYSTMWVRDHQRPVFHDALGVDVTWYGQEVFRKTSEGTRQIFPLTLDIDHPRWRPNLDRMEVASRQVAAGKARGGVMGTLTRVAGMAKAAYAFVALFTIPAHKNVVPENTRMHPVY